MTIASMTVAYPVTEIDAMSSAAAVSSETEQLVPLCELLTPTFMEQLIENGTSPEELFMHYWWCSTENLILWGFKTFAVPMIIIIGSIGNALAFTLLTRHSLQQWSVCFYLALYAILNTIVLYIGCGLDWLSYVTNTIHIANQADWTCRVWKFAFNVMNYAGGWVVVAMSTDRVIQIWYPHHAHQFCTVFMSKLVTVFMLVGLVVISIHAMWTYALTRHGCIIEVSEGTHAFTAIAWPIVSAIFYSYLPVLLILTLDIFIIISLLQGLLDTASSVRDQRSDDCAHSTTQLHHNLAVTVLTIGLFYLLLNLPTIIINIYMYSLTEFSAKIRLRAQLFLLQELSQGMACLNNALSFVIYFGLVPLIRHEFRVMVRVVSRSPQTNVTDTVLELCVLEANGEGPGCGGGGVPGNVMETVL